MTYLLVTDTLKLPLTDEEAEKVEKVLLDGGSRFMKIQGQLINKAFVRGVFDFYTYTENEEDYLATKGKARCGACGRILKINDRCPCRDDIRFERRHPLRLEEPESLKKLLSNRKK